MTAYDRLLLPENLNYAWLKAKKLYWTADGYIDNGELAEFELDLEHRLIKIRQQFKRGVWRLKRLRPLPRPKKIKDGVPFNRQYYHVAVDDQVAWIAVVNAIGPELDQHMPPWSYGNRIYRPAWYEHEEDRNSTLEIGPYRHASGWLYRKFKHSWPLFRRHVALTARTMAHTLTLPADRDELDQAERLAAAVAEKEGLPYLKAGFWEPPNGTARRTDLYHASIDLRQFYPSLRSEAVLAGLGLAGATDDDRMRKLLTDMLRFRIDKSEMPPETLERVEPDFDSVQIRGIPTGLFVAGFLANAAMLPVDTTVNQRILGRRSLAHFRFVDDHTILAYDFEELCAWIDSYQTLLIQCNTGVCVNTEKYDPVSLGEWMGIRTEASVEANVLSEKTRVNRDQKEQAAIRDTRFNGANPTRLLTKTLGQVSAIAAANVDILDDLDLQERLNQLEWLLLADIPAREIRPDTRAAFAAGKIAELAPILVQEPDGLIEAARSLEILKANAPKPEQVTRERVEEYKTAVEAQRKDLEELQAEHRRDEERHLRRCFDLLLQAFREYPEKARLFYRMHEYCRATGFRGLHQIASWIRDARERGHGVWADYYAGLSLQILARGVLLAARAWKAEDALRSEKEAAWSYLEDVSQVDIRGFSGPRKDEAWFHAVSRKEFGAALLSVAAVVRQADADTRLSQGLERLADKCLSVSFNSSADAWELETARRPGVWAHLAECILSVDDSPSPAWERFERLFSFSHVPDHRATRRYPERLSDAGWDQLLHSEKSTPKTDSGWLRDAMDGNDGRIEAARSSKKSALRLAARSLAIPSKGWMTLAKWTELVSDKFSPFDPRRSEWTALEIVRQVVSPIIDEPSADQSRLDRLHPNNLLVPESWKTEFACEPQMAGISWEAWRQFVQSKPIKLRASAMSVLDYRYFTATQGGRHLNDWERRLVGVGRLLLGLLRLNHHALRIWNVRGNEQIFMLPQTRWFQSLAISSSTLLLIEGCLSGRSAETRAIAFNPGLFGWEDGREANDIEFDPPSLVGPNELLCAIVSAQQVLEVNQLAVGMNQPRQLIPFRISDFSAGADGEGEEDDLGE